ncbi:poly(ethylene terephthalate) hydrolase family protein [Nocardia bovistercoris]|uniref:PET hydrolase/cutinase-like domain-containing protein n=1 Tax=Nocardia bovistercoris TaxID=2785916 RepID=A0A931I7M5_9NOCA|nr:alpha/beta hydrolase [Nocardia bovistercoris]MBH0775247.1 hypothetical protein [Nocardia bovistercoris]
MIGWVRTFLIAAVAVATQATVVVAQADPVGFTPNPGIEATYSAPGPWRVSERISVGCCDSAGASFDLWYPSGLGAGGAGHLIVLWGNGTNAVPTQYRTLLRHLASWGFVVVATEHTATGSGVEIRDSLRYLLDRAADPADELHGKLDTAAVGAVGHSQGATGVVNALRDARGAIATAVPLEIPAQALCSNRPTCADTRTLSTGSVFFVNGSSDGFISPSNQSIPWQIAGLQSNRAYYEATPPHVPKVWATLNGVDHNDVQGQPDCAGASAPCGVGVYGFLGYPTAWLMAELRGDADARRAFRMGGELFAPSAHWSNQTGSAWG